MEFSLFRLSNGVIVPIGGEIIVENNSIGVTLIGLIETFDKFSLDEENLPDSLSIELHNDDWIELSKMMWLEHSYSDGFVTKIGICQKPSELALATFIL